MSELNYETFAEGMEELQSHYNKQLSKFALSAWYKYLKNRMSDDRFVGAIEECLCTREFMPTPEKLAEIIGADTSCPGENWISYKQSGGNYFALPSTEIVVESLTEEQRYINLQKISAEIAARKDMKSRKKYSKPAYERFGDMRKMLLSGVPWMQREAVVWGKGQENVLFIYADSPNGLDYPSDMKWLGDVPDEDLEF